jgi:heme ABC exporter ATP-binding subunit CcmA
MMLLVAEHISKQFASVPVLQQVSFSLRAIHTLSILGKSGCGKTTLLKIIAGLTAPDKGNILLNGTNINQQPANKRKIVYMGQEPLLFPHLTVFENIAFGLRIQKMPGNLVKEKVQQLLFQLGLQEHQQKMPHQLSGGQQQRVNFGRALIINPPLLLLDEPFGNLDAQTRTEMQQLFKQVAQQFSITTLFVTHDIKEALLMGDSIGYMQQGQLTIYNSQQSFIADGNTGAAQEIAFWQSL